MCCYNRDGGAGFTLRTIWRAAAVTGMPPPPGVIVQSVKENHFGVNLLILFSFYSTLHHVFRLSSPLGFCLCESSSLCTNMVGNKDNSVILHTSSSSASNVQTEEMGGWG